MQLDGCISKGAGIWVELKEQHSPYLTEQECQLQHDNCYEKNISYNLFFIYNKTNFAEVLVSIFCVNQ